jgi:hypothetical protein
MQPAGHVGSGAGAANVPMARSARSCETDDTTGTLPTRTIRKTLRDWRIPPPIGRDVLFPVHGHRLKTDPFIAGFLASGRFRFRAVPAPPRRGCGAPGSARYRT